VATVARPKVVSLAGWPLLQRSSCGASPRLAGDANAVRRPNRGALFREQKEKETDHDYSGTINIGGVEYWLSGWVKTSKKGFSEAEGRAPTKTSRSHRATRWTTGHFKIWGGSA
jgi:hypothetical protein